MNVEENINEIYARISSFLDLYENRRLNRGDLDNGIDALLTELRSYRTDNQNILTTLALLEHNLQQLKDMQRDIFSPSSNLQLFEAAPLIEQSPERERGRPRYLIPSNTLTSLRQLGMSWTKIAEVFAVSRWTIYRRVSEYGIDITNRFSDFSDDELLEIIGTYLTNQSRLVGFSMVYGHLESIGIHVQQRRVRTLLRQFDPEFSAMRWAAVIHRRAYNVRAPNSLWHLDGHHSLIKYGFVIHGCIDGFSRLITFLKCSTNNTALTVLESFVDAIEVYGVPSRIRTDFGGENTRVWELMENLMGVGRGSALRGTSTQNQRIERLWRDVFRCVSSTYYFLFQAMSDSGILNIEILLHKVVLQYVFLPRINRSLNLFSQAWNNHPLRTERSRSPVHIWQLGMIDVRNRQLNTTGNVLDAEGDNVDDLEWYGYDPNVHPPGNNNENVVVVDDVLDNFINLRNHLRRNGVDPLGESPNLGVDIYLHALEVFSDLMDGLGDI